MRIHILAALVALTASASAQQSVYYLSNGDGQTVVAVQNGSVIRRWSTGIYCYPIAVANDRVMVSDGYANRNAGKQYDTQGNLIGNLQVRGSTSYSLDSCSDGTYNYWWVDGSVWRGGLDWSGAQRLFSATGHRFGGITYDRVNDSIWVSNHGGTITQYSKSGSPLSSFNTGQSDQGLGWDPATDTLWMWTQGADRFRQYSKTGNLIATHPWNDQYNDNVIGGEFDTMAGAGSAVPASSTWTIALTITAMLALLACCRRCC